MDEKNITLVDIARLCGVGKSTVSLVINQSDKVKQSTREHIEAVIREQGYIPSKAARSLRSQREKIVGIISSRIDAVAECLAVRAMLPSLYALGYDAIVMETLPGGKRLKDNLALLEARHVDGVIVFGSALSGSKALKGWKKRAVVIEGTLTDSASVNYDGVGAVALLMAWMKQKGVRNVAWLGAELADAGGEKYRAYLRCCEKYGFTPESRQGELTYQGGYQLASQCVSAGTEGLLCAADELALGALKYLQERQLEPAVGSIGGTSLLHFLHPSVVSVKLDYAHAGQQAVRLLMKMINDEPREKRVVIAGCIKQR